MSKFNPVPQAERVPVRDKIIVGAGAANTYLVNNLTTGMLWLPIFNIGFGINAAVLGIIAMVFKAWDAFLNPFVGNLSDNTRTRWGRRRPYIAVASVVTACLLPAVWWMDQDWEQWQMVTYLTAFGLLLFTAYTFWIIPLEGLQMEMSPNYDERTSITSYSAFFAKLVAAAGGWTMAVISSDFFADPTTGEPDLVAGVRAISIGFGLAFLAIGILPGLFVKERLYKNLATGQASEGFIQSIKETARLRPLWILIAIIFTNLLGIVSISGLGYYINIYFVNAGDIKGASWIEGYRHTATFLTGILSIPFWKWFSQKYDKKITLYVVLSMTMVGHLLNYFCLNPEMPYLQLIPSIFYSCVGATIWMIAPSMKMDVADYDELHTGRRREGSINSVFSFILTLAITVSTGLGGIVLQLTGFDEALKEQPQAVLDNMFYTYLLLPLAFWAVSVVLVRYYHLNRDRMREIRTELEARRGAY